MSIVLSCVGYDMQQSWPPLPCIFPFEYKGVNHTGCMKEHQQNDTEDSRTELPPNCKTEHGCCPTDLATAGQPSAWGSCNSACQSSSK